MYAKKSETRDKERVFMHVKTGNGRKRCTQI